MAEIWVIKSSAHGEFVTTQIPFTSNGQKFTSIGTNSDGTFFILCYDSMEIAGYAPGVDTEYIFDDEAYRKLTFDTPPTGALLSWLQANATKQVVEYLVTDTDLIKVANAIRAKSGTTEKLSFPDGMASAVRKIPSGVTGLSLGITGATVGQIAKITAVDETGKPTKWEPVDMAGGDKWEKLVDTSLAEAVESETYTFDNCKRVKALIAPAIASGESFSGWTRITINNVSYPVFNSRIDNTKGMYIEIDSVYPPYVQASIGTNSNTITYGFNGGIQTTALENIAPNGVTEFGCQTAGLLKAGTKIEIWGVKS